MTNSRLEPVFGVLVGGEWNYIPNGPDDPIRMVHEFKWELDKHALVAHSYNPGTTPRSQVSSDIWYWHPVKKTICSMGVVLFGPEPSLFEYTEVKREGNTLVCDFSTHDSDGVGNWRETWEFSDDNHYAWTLYKHTDTGPEKVRTGVFERRK